MPHSYASSLARLNRRGPTIGAIATEKSANAVARASSPAMGMYGASDMVVWLRPFYRPNRFTLLALFRVAPWGVGLLDHRYTAGASFDIALMTRSIESPPRGS